MAIHKLPPQAIRSLGSSQVLTTSSSVVKELIDNSLDAGATAITVEISLNTVDIIQVKDNGHGVPAADRDLMGIRCCTSKILQFEDIHRLGGSMLGFRGEALASACELSGTVSATTKEAGETVAELLRFSRKGEISE
jgi:DNA mismatch repair ATPase MutL